MPLRTRPESAAWEQPGLAPATQADVPAVIALIGRVFAEYGFVYDPATEVPDLLAFDAHYAPPDGAFFVVRHDGGIIGSVGVEKLGREGAELHRLYLDAGWRGRGLGQQLVDVVLGWCRAQGLARLTLWSDTRFDRAHRLYTRLGFRQVGERTLVGDVNQTREYRFERGV